MDIMGEKKSEIDIGCFEAISESRWHKNHDCLTRTLSSRIAAGLPSEPISRAHQKIDIENHAEGSLTLSPCEAFLFSVSATAASQYRGG